MSVDVMMNPPFVETPLRWYSPADTTPFALCGHLGPVLAAVPFEKFGSTVKEIWFGDNGWEDNEGAPFDESDVLAFAIPRPPYADVMDKLWAALEEIFDCDTASGAWLDTPQAGLGDKTPRQVVEAGDGERLLIAVDFIPRQSMPGASR